MKEIGTLKQRNGLLEGFILLVKLSLQNLIAVQLIWKSKLLNY